MAGKDGEVERPAERLIRDGWDGLNDVVDHLESGYLLFPEALLRRRKDGSVERTPIMLRVPREHEFRKARSWARRQALEDGLDPERDADLIANLENIHLLSLSIRNATAPYEPMEPDALRLERTYDRACLMQLWSKVDKLHARIDPSDQSIGPEEMLALMARLSEARHLGPLAAYGSAAQTSFVLSMVDQLLTLLVRKSSQASRADSTPE